MISISFTDITESIFHIRRASKQKAATEQILNFLRKKDQYRDLSAADLEEEIQQRIIKINLIVLTTILIMKQAKMKIVLHRPKRIQIIVQKIAFQIWWKD